jgi:hypothetical protein
MKRFLISLMIASFTIMLSGCQAVASLLPTQTPNPTYTPNPTFTPYPTYTPIPSPTSTPEKKVLFEENDFSSVDSCFDVNSGSGVRRFAEDGQYHIVVQDKNFYGWSICDNDLRNFVLEVDATVIEGPENNNYAYGVILREDTAGNGFYSFLLSGDGYYAFSGIYPPNDYYPLLSWSAIREINQGKKTNHLKVVAIGDQFELYVNDKTVGLVREGTTKSGPFGFIVETFEDPGEVQVAFDNLQITEP